MAESQPTIALALLITDILQEMKTKKYLWYFAKSSLSFQKVWWNSQCFYLDVNIHAGSQLVRPEDSHMTAPQFA